jgi:UDP-N-acetylglucosamine 2-epimerase (non-hydrolysing)
MSMLAVIGTRPEAIKLAPVIKATGCEVVCTGQHPLSMVAPILDFFEIENWEWLGCEHGETLNERLGEYLPLLDGVFEEMEPSVVIVQGDTTSALAGALAAFHRQIPVAHVEAGLRTYNLDSPFPEEANRQLISRIATWHFCPTRKALDGLMQEWPFKCCGGGAVQDWGHMVGNTVVDALEWARDKIDKSPWPTGYILATVHRRENWDKIHGICMALNELQDPPNNYVAATIHPNPTVRDTMRACLDRGVTQIDAPAYPEFLKILAGARVVLTDSGGVQEEAAAFNKPCLVLRDNTEREEGIEAGCAKLVGTDPDRIVATCKQVLTDATLYRKMSEAANPYGDGHAAERIAAILREAQ